MAFFSVECVCVRLLSIDHIEQAVGDRLRLPMYWYSFRCDLYDSIAATLIEGQSPHYLAQPLLLSQWHAKYHPHSGPLRISNAVELESFLGKELRKLRDTRHCMIRRLLHNPVKTVLVSPLVVKTWMLKYRQSRLRDRSRYPG